MRFLLIALVACNGKPAPRDAPKPPPPPALSPIFSKVASDLDASAVQLRKTEALVAVRAVIAKLVAVHPFELEKIDRVRAQLAVVEHQLVASAKILSTGKIADAIDPLAKAVEAGYAGDVGTLPSALVDELVDLREGCKRIENAACADVEKIGDGYEAAQQLGGVPRAALDDAAAALSPLATDVHTRTVLDRAAGKGPSFGAPCGPEDLCARFQTCEAATHTCEHACFAGAMDPCPGNRRCVVADAGLTGVCR